MLNYTKYSIILYEDLREYYARESQVYKRVTMRLNSGENDDDRHASIASVFYYTAKIRFIKDKPY